MSKFPIGSYDSLVAKVEDKKQNAATVKLKKQEELRGKLGNAKIATIEAQEELEKSIVTSGHSIDTAALAFKEAKATEEFYQDLYDSVFPEDKKK